MSDLTYILDKEIWAMVPLFSHIMNIGSAQWGQILFEGVFLFTKDIYLQDLIRMYND